MSETKKQLKKFDLVESSEFHLGIIISEPFTANFASFTGEPFDITDPASYDWVVDDMVLVYVYMPPSRVEAMRLVNLRPATYDLYNAYVPCDYAQEAICEALSLKKFADKIHEQFSSGNR